jgi:hypothetical protein
VRQKGWFSHGPSKPWMNMPNLTWLGRIRRSADAPSEGGEFVCNFKGSTVSESSSRAWSASGPRPDGLHRQVSGFCPESARHILSFATRGAEMADRRPSLVLRGVRHSKAGPSSPCGSRSGRHTPLL